MNRLRASLFQGSILAFAAACGLDAQAQITSPPPGRAQVILYRSDKQPVGARVPAAEQRLAEAAGAQEIQVLLALDGLVREVRQEVVGVVRDGELGFRAVLQAVRRGVA